jgi:REP element-mobilizing transposase RayT
VVLTDEVDQVLKDICVDLSIRYEIHFVERGTDKDHVHFLVQSVPAYSPRKLYALLKA